MKRYAFVLTMLLVAPVSSSSDELPCQYLQGEAIENVPFAPPPAELQHLDGSWKGRLDGKTLDGYHEECAWNYEMEIRIGGDQAMVTIVGTETPGMQPKSSAFSVERRGTTAVLTRIGDGETRKASFVESWTLTITMKDAKTALVWCTRSVNNYAMDPDHRMARFAFVGAGSLERVAE